VFGALAGARRINDACVAAYGASGIDDGIVLHVTGTRDYDEVARAVTAPPERYRTLASTDRFWTILAAADLAVSRAGGTVWELAAAGLPALLVPYPHATGDHQHANARQFAAAGGAVIVEDAALHGGTLRTLVSDLRAGAERLEQMRAGMRACARPEAAATVARELLRLTQGRE
jgi:UDP-N-acetylglucosamine--N-acetylmuramyl-(pentapeptide) pyrophosphoryl-undecaprenol N-acetylglucosamine transferase